MRLLGKILTVIGEILAIVLVVVYALVAIDANFPFISNVPVLYNIVKIVLYYGMLALIAVVGLSAVLKHNIVFIIFFLAFLVVAVIFMFFPGTFTELIGLIK